MDYKKKIKELQEEITKHDILYSENKPIITDTEYDNLYFELLKLEAEYPECVTPESPTQKIIEKKVEGLSEVVHSTPMLSQQKSKTIDEVMKWVAQADGIVKNNAVVLQHKLDGLTLVLTYDGGKLTKAVTRGDGKVGEDVLHNANCIRNIPKRINFKEHFEVRGEVIINYQDFERVNLDGEYSNPRNLASGTIRQLDSSICSERNLRFIAFDLVTNLEDYTTEPAAIGLLRELGFTVVPTTLVDFEQGVDLPGLTEKLKDVIQKIESSRQNLQYLIDGIVLKFANRNLQEELGYTAKHPRFAIAYKFASEDAVTTLRSVTVQLGRNGFVTPVANFDPINIGGVEIARATLHNYKNIIDKDIRIGDQILVARANDVIPKVNKSFHELRHGDESKIDIPTVCPICGEDLSASEGVTGTSDALLVCTNDFCEGKELMKLIYFASRDALDIDTLGESVITKLYEEGLVVKATDFYTNIEPNRHNIENFEKFGKKKVDNLLKAIEKSKEAPLSSFLAALSIRNVGLNTSKEIAKEFKSMANLLTALETNDFDTRVQNIEGLGDTAIQAIRSYFTEENKDLINEFMTIGFSLVEPIVSLGEGLKGKTFVITGKLSKGRDEFVKLIEAHGGKSSGSVSKKTTYLLLGEGEENSSKYKKAVELGIVILNEDQFNDLLK